MTRDNPEIARTWDTFHRLVNLTSPELRDWLLTTPDGANAYARNPVSTSTNSASGYSGYWRSGGSI